jgi:pyrroloquinoline quinone biosynthesis protein B
MIVKVLGSAAGGGFPQANCNCRNCADVRVGKPGLTPRTQSSLAVTGDGERWVLLNASPDIRQQIAATPALAPRPDGGARSSPIAAVALTNADVDHVAGLLSLREGLSFSLYATARVLDTLAANSIFNVLGPRHVARMTLPLGSRIEVEGGLAIVAYPVPGKVALYLEDTNRGLAQEGDGIGLEVSDPATGAAFHYIPGCAVVDAALARRLDAARLVLFDGTLYSDDEMITQGLSDKTGQRMGHISMSGRLGSMAAFSALGVERRVFVHINNSNPVLRDDSLERTDVQRSGWEIAYDGMEIRL